MATRHDVKLVLRGAGKELFVYDRYSVVVDMLDAGNPMTFSLWYSQQNDNAWDVLMEHVKLGDQMVLSIDGATQCVSRIEDFGIDVDTQHGARIIIAGRDLAGPAIEWEVKPTLVARDDTLEDLLTKAFQPLGIDVIVGVHADAERQVRGRQRPGRRGSTTTRTSRKNKIDHGKPHPGETVWQFAESIVRKLGYAMWVAPGEDGKLAVVIDKPAYNQEPLFKFTRRVVNGQVTQDSNILWSKYKKTVRGIPTDVFTFGRATRGDGTAARVCGHYRNKLLATDSRVYQPFNTQPKYLRNARTREILTAEQEARRYCSKANAKFQTYSIGVQGHAQKAFGDMHIYTINTMSTVVDDVTRLNEAMLITRVEFNGTFDGGQTTTIMLGRKDAIDLEPEPEK